MDTEGEHGVIGWRITALGLSGPIALGSLASIITRADGLLVE
jgi:hypothetical protein